jgi:hypothetical protein
MKSLAVAIAIGLARRRHEGRRNPTAVAVDGFRPLNTSRSRLKLVA